MPTVRLALGLRGIDERYSGTTAVAALDNLRDALMRAKSGDVGKVVVEIAYKEYRRIRRVGGRWVLEASENGVGSTTRCAHQIDAIDQLLRCCAEDGDHWDWS